jgi:beta-glucosidase-like glycosyl hydrolase
VRAVRAEGLATARNLRGVGVGVNVDLAPVLDLGLPGSFQRRLGRSFAATPAGVSRYGGAFADGLAAGGVLATAKALAAVRAGDDLLLFCQSASAAARGAAALRRAVVNGAIPRAQIDAGADRVLALRDRLRRGALARRQRADLCFTSRLRCRR